jgi:hypothetical protein
MDRKCSQSYCRSLHGYGNNQIHTRHHGSDREAKDPSCSISEQESRGHEWYLQPGFLLVVKRIVDDWFSANHSKGGPIPNGG